MNETDKVNPFFEQRWDEEYRSYQGTNTNRVRDSWARNDLKEGKYSSYFLTQARDRLSDRWYAFRNSTDLRGVDRGSVRGSAALAPVNEALASTWPHGKLHAGGAGPAAVEPFTHHGYSERYSNQRSFGAARAAEAGFLAGAADVAWRDQSWLPSSSDRALAPPPPSNYAGFKPQWSDPLQRRPKAAAKAVQYIDTPFSVAQHAGAASRRW